MECVGFVIVGGDVGATQYGADSRAVQVLTLPLTLHTGAVNRVTQSLHPERPAQIHMMLMWRVKSVPFFTLP